MLHWVLAKLITIGLGPAVTIRGASSKQYNEPVANGSAELYLMSCFIDFISTIKADSLLLSSSEGSSSA
jgi:hypothetical protein